jgi:multidrug resistance protein MdtO
MKLAAYLPERLLQLARFFREELTEARPGRVAQTVQLGSLALVVVLVSMTLNIPMTAVSLIVLFYGVQPNAFFTRLVCVVFVVATVLDVGGLLLVLKYAYGYPLVRIVAANVILFASMYLFRTNKLGLMFFAVALVLAYGQSIPDTLDFPELAVRAVLWAVVAGLYAVFLMAIVCGYLFPARPRVQLQRALQEQLARVSASLQWLMSPASQGAAPEPLSGARMDKDAVALQQLHVFAAQDDSRYGAAQPYWRACIAVVSYLRATTAAAAAHGVALSEAGRALVSKVHAEVAALSASVASAQPYQSTWTPTEAERTISHEFGLSGFVRSLQDLARFDFSQPVTKPAAESLFVADALSNPDYLRFAFKVVLASFICYVFYHGMQWDGIHTSLLTCVIVAFPSTGASFQKMILRFGGAVVGALLALFFTIVIAARIDGIFGLLITLAPIFFAGAWVATGSERSSYIGTQFVFTFSMATLEDGFGPIYDLTEIRDRIIGIFIGIAVSAVIYTLIWPESEAGLLRRKLADAVKQIGKLVARPQKPGGSEQLGYLQQRMACSEALNTCEAMVERVALEINLQPAIRHNLLHASRGVLTQSRLIVATWDVLRDELIARNDEWPDAPGLQAWCAHTAQVLNRYADGLSADPLAAGAAGSLALVPPARMTLRLAAQEADFANQISALPDWTISAPGADGAAV